MPLMLRDGVSTADTDYGTTLLDEHSGDYWTLNPTGALVLRALLDGGTPVEAAKALTEQYAVDPDVATRDVADLVDGLQSAGLVREE
jgi:coenzyme PQQ synthesis protein D (PqqD)